MHSHLHCLPLPCPLWFTAQRHCARAASCKACKAPHISCAMNGGIACGIGAAGAPAHRLGRCAVVWAPATAVAAQLRRPSCQPLLPHHRSICQSSFSPATSLATSPATSLTGPAPAARPAAEARQARIQVDRLTGSSQPVGASVQASRAARKASHASQQQPLAVAARSKAGTQHGSEAGTHAAWPAAALPCAPGRPQACQQ